MGGPENCNFPLLYVVKMSLRRWVGASKSLKTPLRNIKMTPNLKLFVTVPVLGFLCVFDRSLVDAVQGIALSSVQKHFMYHLLNFSVFRHVLTY